MRRAASQQKPKQTRGACGNGRLRLGAPAEDPQNLTLVMTLTEHFGILNLKSNKTAGQKCCVAKSSTPENFT